MKVHNLYRCFNGDGELLYVGISWTAARRFGQHSNGSPWWGEVAEITLEKFPDRDRVREAERLAIQNEKPLFNIALIDTPAPAPSLDPAIADWQVVRAAKNRSGAWNVDLLPPGGEPTLGSQGIEAESAAEAVEIAIDECADLLSQEFERGFA